MTVEPLTDEHQQEALAFLAARPPHTAIMSGWIRDNGVVSPLNRGAFYACRDSRGRLEGVALIGRFVMFETTSDAALKASARFAQDCSPFHMAMGEEGKLERFWNYYKQPRQTPRLVCHDLLFEQRQPVDGFAAVHGLRRATPDDLAHLLPAHAQMVLEETGVNPMEVDPAGFRQRYARRIELGRVWVWAERGRLIFKVDVVTETPEVIYIEGVYVHPERRRMGYGVRCLSQLSRNLLTGRNSICGFTEAGNKVAAACYHKTGYKLRGRYTKIYL